MICIYCSTEFATKGTLKRHLVTKRCKFKVFLEDGNKAFEFIEEHNKTLELSKSLQRKIEELDCLKKELLNKNLMLSHQKMLLKQEYMDLHFNQDQINLNQELINYYSNKTNVFYAFLLKYNDEYYCKFGLVGELRTFQERIKEHKKEFKYISFFNVIECSNIHKVESDFKKSSLFCLNKVTIPKKCGIGVHIEIIKLNEFLTANLIKEEMIRVAGERILG